MYWSLTIEVDVKLNDVKLWDFFKWIGFRYHITQPTLVYYLSEQIKSVEVIFDHWNPREIRCKIVRFFMVWNLIPHDSSYTSVLLIRTDQIFWIDVWELKSTSNKSMKKMEHFLNLLEGFGFKYYVTKPTLLLLLKFNFYVK